ncbi:hypothetical protein HZS_2496, partial [Henneguya salminicola]
MEAEESGKIKKMCDDLEQYVDNSLNRIHLKLKNFLEAFTKSKRKIQSNIPALPTPRIEANSLTPDTSLNARFPKFISPSIGKSTYSSPKAHASHPELNLKKFDTLTAVVRGYLVQLLYNSKTVLEFRDTITESQKLLDDMENDSFNTSFVECELRQRLLIEIDMAKTKIN